MSKEFYKFDSVTKSAFDELNKLIEENPQDIIDITLDLLNDEDIITPIFTEYSTLDSKSDKLNNKIRFISLFYEIASIFRLIAFLISKRKPDIELLRGSESVLSHLKPLGLTTRDINNLRKIRNAKSHKFYFENGYFIAERNFRISKKNLLSLYNKIENISSYCTTFLFSQILCQPKFGILIGLAVFRDLSNDNSYIKKYFFNIKEFLPEIFEEEENNDSVKQNSKTITTRSKRDKTYSKLKKKIRGFFNLKTDFQEDIFNNIPTLFKRLDNQIKEISEDLVDMSEKLDNQNDKDNLMKFTKWIVSKRKKLNNFIESIESVDYAEFKLKIRNSKYLK